MSLNITIDAPKGKIQIGDGLPTHLVAEIGLNHNGNVTLAKDMVYQAALAGATFVKFQKRHPKTLATAEYLDAPFPKCPALGTTQREVRERLELSFDEYQEVVKYANELGLIFSSSAFDIISLDFLMKLESPIIKIASHSITNGPLIKKVAEYKVPVFCSVGAVTEKETDKAVEILSGNPLVLLHCISSYPTPDNIATLDTIQDLKERYHVPVGFSSHELGIDISVAAVALGACMVERHFTLNRAMVGLDQGISLTPDEFSEMALRIKRVEKCRGIRKEFLGEEITTRNNYHVGVYTARPIKKGTAIKAEDIVCRQPLESSDLYFTGLDTDAILGKKALQDLLADTLIPRIAVDA